MLFHMVLFGAFNGAMWSPFTSWMIPTINPPYLFGFFDWGLGAMATYVLIFVSGAVLAYSHPRVESLQDYGKFIERRLNRLYPAFWVAFLVTALFALEVVMSAKPVDLLISFLGFSTFLGQWSGVPGGMMYTTFWFIGLIVSLYLLYPFISKAIEAAPHRAMLAFILISVVSIALVSTFWSFPRLDVRWFPLCSLAWFAAGVYVVKQGYYPKVTHDNVAIARLSEVTFYVFLLHYIRPFVFLITLDPFIYLMATIVAAFWLMELDGFIQKRL